MTPLWGYDGLRELPVELKDGVWVGVRVGEVVGVGTGVDAGVEEVGVALGVAEDGGVRLGVGVEAGEGEAGAGGGGDEVLPCGCRRRVPSVQLRRALVLPLPWEAHDRAPSSQEFSRGLAWAKSWGPLGRPRC